MDTVRMCRETDDKTKRTQADVGKRLGERIGDIQFWKVSMNNELVSYPKDTLWKTLGERLNRPIFTYP